MARLLRSLALVALCVGCAPESPAPAAPDAEPDATGALGPADAAPDASPSEEPDAAPPEPAPPELDAALDAALDADPVLPPDAAPPAPDMLADAAADPACREGCARAAACNLVLFDDCMARCEAPVDDPLAVARVEERAVCARTAPDCAALDGCWFPPPAAPWGDLSDEVDPELCAAIDACVPGGCGLVSGQARGRPVGLACVADIVDGGCPPDALNQAVDCLQAEARACDRLCAAREICEAAIDRAECAALCEARALADADADRAAQVAELGCATAGTCGELADCRASIGPVAACADHCDALAECGLSPDCDGDCCRARCMADAPRVWHQRWRACVGAADGCDAIADCAPGPRLPCEARCEAERACGLDDGTCDARCADDGALDVERSARRLACIVEAPACRFAADAVAACLDDAAAGGEGCLETCRARVGCDAAPDVLGACIERCGRGDFATWSDDPVCVEAAPDACPAEVPCPAPDDMACVARCERLAACGAPIGPDCPAACAGDALSRHAMASHGTCLDAADDCDAIGACLALPPPPAAVDEPTFCARYAGCDALAGIPCAVALDVVGDDPAVRVCVYDGLIECPDDPFALLDACRGVAFEADLHCDRHCVAAHACGAADDLGACRRACREARAVGEQRPAPCARALSCASLDDCLAPPG